MDFPDDSPLPACSWQGCDKIRQRLYSKGRVKPSDVMAVGQSRNAELAILLRHLIRLCSEVKWFAVLTPIQVCPCLFIASSSGKNNYALILPSFFNLLSLSHLLFLVMSDFTNQSELTQQEFVWHAHTCAHAQSHTHTYRYVCINSINWTELKKNANLFAPVSCGINCTNIDEVLCSPCNQRDTELHGSAQKKTGVNQKWC